MEYKDHEVSGLLSFYVDGTRCRLVGDAVGPGRRILDVGCGNGQLIPYLPSPAAYTGVEMDAGIVEWCRKRYPNFRFVAARAGADPLPEGPFDAAILAGFIEHIEPALHLPLLRGVRRVIAPGGIVVLTTPTVFGGRFHKWLSKIGLVSREAAEEHKGFLSKERLSALFREAGFRVEKHDYYFCGMAHRVLARPV